MKLGSTSSSAGEHHQEQTIIVGDYLEENRLTALPNENIGDRGSCSDTIMAEECSVDEDFYSCKTTISTYDFNGIYADDSEDDRHRASSASVCEIPESS